MLIESYKQQYDKMIRSFKKIKDQNRDQLEYFDDVWTFFENCFHLKDWIKNDDSLPKHIRGKIEGKVENSDALRIVADLANRSKHLTLNRRKREDADISTFDTTIIAGKMHLNMKTGEKSSEPCQVKYSIFINTKDRDKIDGLQVAESAISEWERIMTELGIPY